MLERGPWCAAAVLGIWAVGAAYAHIDATEPSGQIASKLRIARPVVVLVDERNRHQAERYASRYLAVEDNGTGDYGLIDGLTPDDLAYVVFTSGSTGTPKAVQVEHGAILNYEAALRARIHPASPASWGITTTFAADLGNTCVFGALLSGARLDIYDREVLLDSTALARELTDHPVDCLKYTPSQLEAFAAGGDLAAVLPRSVLLLGGEPFPPGLAAVIAAARPDLAVYNHYGPSEATIGVLMHGM